MASTALQLEIHPVKDLTAEQHRASAQMKKYLAKFFKEQGKKLAKEIGAAYGAATKASTPKDDILAAAKLEEWSVIAPELEAALGPTFEQTAQIILGKLEIDNQHAFDLVSERAVNYADQNAADLVTQITQTTRDRLNALVADAIENADGVNELMAAIEDSEAFSPARAEMIARTEIGNAHMSGALEGAKASGLDLKKSIIRGSQDFDCEICGDNEDQGEIGLDEMFDSGDEAPLFHPNCECSLVFSVVASAE